MAFVYVPNGAIPAAFWPAGDGGADFALSPTLAPLANVHKQLQVIAGLHDLSANAGPDGAGDHARASGTFLTGVRIKKTAGADIRAGVSIDQVVANQIGHLTRFSSLELTCDAVRKAGDCDSGYACAYEYNLAWRSHNQPLSPEHNPRFVFERLFGSGSPRERVANLKRRAGRTALHPRLRARRRALGQCEARRPRPAEARPIPHERARNRTAHRKLLAPSGEEPRHRRARGNSRQLRRTRRAHVRHAGARVPNRLHARGHAALSREGSNRSFADIGIASGHHDLSHHKNTPEIIEKVKLIDRWYVQRFSRSWKSCRATEDVDGQSLLHHSMILYGSGNADGNRHTHEDLPIVLAGSGSGALRPGRYVKTGGVPISNLFLSMADAMGAKMSTATATPPGASPSRRALRRALEQA